MFKYIIIQTVVPTAAKAATQAAIARMVSNRLTVAAAGARCTVGAGRVAAAGAAAGAAARGAAVVVRGAATGAATPAGRGGGAPGTELGAPVGPPGGSVGNLIVGAADGLGGKLIRTVSFFGWTLPVDFFMGVTGEPGEPGMGGGGVGLSGIMLHLKISPPNKLSNQIPKLFEKIQAQAWLEFLPS